MVEYLNRICCKFTTESISKKKFENRIIVGEVMAKSLVSCFLTHGVVYYTSADCNGRTPLLRFVADLL